MISRYGSSQSWMSLRASSVCSARFGDFKMSSYCPCACLWWQTKLAGRFSGAFDRGKMVAFCLCIPGLKPGGKQYFHSHMLGVLPPYRNTGLGRRMKLAQRQYALACGIDLIEWTFDPLELKNAFFNIERLGAIARRYVHNQYGRTSSHLHGGLPTDRLIAEWWIASPRVDAIVNHRPIERPSIEARIEVPTNISALVTEDAERAREDTNTCRRTIRYPLPPRVERRGYRKKS